MPRQDKPVKKSSRREDSDDESVDSEGNIRNLIDYDYKESDSDSSLSDRKAKKKAMKRLKRIADNNSKEKSKSKDTHGFILSDSDEEEEPKKKVSTKSAPIPIPTKKRIEPTLVVSEPLKKKKKAKPVVEEEESEEEEEEESEDSGEEQDVTDDEEDDSEEDEDFSDDEEEEEEHSKDSPKKRRGGNTIDIVFSDMLGGNERDPNKPHKYNLKKEPESVRRFVKLVQKEDDGEEDTIDNDITYFKSLSSDKQSNLIKVLEHKNTPTEVQVPLKFKILEKVATKPDLSRIAMAKYNALCSIDPSSTEYYKCGHWIQGFTGLPLGVYKDLPVKIEDGTDKCAEFMDKVNGYMNTAIYGHEEAKLQIMQFVSAWIANPKAAGNVLSLHGPMGTGKTSLIKEGVAKALDRPFHFITLGGATDASFLDGHSYTYEGSTWGRIAEILIQSKCMNPVIYFDELDKVSETPKGDEIMNLLIHLTDGSQNDRFQDKYFTGIDLDLSRCLFIFSHNNPEKVNPILRDRMYNIAVQGFSMKEKLLIAQEYLLNAALKEAGLFEKVSMGKEILQHIIEHFTSGEAGVRELKRCIQTIVSKINLLRFYNKPKQVPFYIEGFALPFTMKKEHVDLFLKRKEVVNESIAHLYM
jgi:ATP-dependent Lon protease